MKQAMPTIRCKRLISCILALCFIVTSILTVPIFVNADTDPQKMVEISGDGGRYWLNISNLDANAEYKAYYKYSIETGCFGASSESTLRFVVRHSSAFYQYRLTSHFHQPSYSFEAMGDGEEGWSDISLTFRPYNATATHYIGFEIVASTKVYVADFKLYKIKDGKEEIVKEGFGSFKKSEYNSKNVTVTEKDYDELLFKDTMLNIKGDAATAKDDYFGTTSNYTMRLPNDNNAVNDNKQFRVYFKYRINEGEMIAGTGATFNFATYLKAHQYYIQNSTHNLVGEVFTKTTEGEDGWSDISLTFVTKKNGIFDLGFHFFSETDIDVADFRLYLTVDGKEKLVDIGFDSFKPRNTYSNVIVTKLPYDAEAFKDDGFDDTMYKLEAVNGAKLQKIFNQGSNENNKALTYKVYFKYRLEKGVFGTSDSRTIFFKDLWKGQYQHHTSHNYTGTYGMSRDDGEDGYSDITLNWTTREADKHHVGFTFTADSVIYITDFRMYLVDGENERLIQKGFAGFSDSDTGVTVTEMTYEEDFFKDRMLHITAQEKSRFNMRMLSAKEGETYRLYMQYGIKEGMFGAAEGNTLGVSNMMNGIYTHYSSHHSKGNYAFTRGNGKEGVSDLDFTFTIQKTNPHNLGWWFSAAGEIYIYDFRLYLIENGEEILVEFDMSNLVERHWADNSLREGFVETEYLPYDESLFIENALQLYNSSEESSGVFGTNVSLIGGKEYTLSFLSYYQKGTVRHNKINILLREALGKGNQKKVYYTTDEHDKSAEHFKVNAVTQSLNEYTFTAPADGEYSVAIEMIGLMNAYFADFKLVESSDIGSNLLENGSFSKNLSGWYSETAAVGVGASHFFDTYVAQSFTCPSTRYVDMFSKELLPQQMLHFNLGSGMRRWLSTSIPEARVGDVWYVEFKVGGANVVHSCIAAEPVNHSPFNAACPRVSEEWFDDYYVAVYKVTVTEFAENGNPVGDKGIKVGLTIPANSYGYLLGVKAWKEGDITETNVLRNGDFKYGLSDWAMYWETGLVNHKQDENAPFKVQNENGSVLEVMNHDVKKYELYLDDTRFNDGEWWNADDIVAPEELYTATVQGKLTDQNGTPLSGVSLVLSSDEKVYTAVTSIDGSFKFENIVEGYYTLYMIGSTGKHRATGFENGIFGKDIVNIEVVCDSSSQTTEQVEEQPVGTVTGTVYTPKLETVAGLPVYIGNITSAITDSNGTFTFADIPVGEYELYTVSKNGDKYVFRTVTVKEDVSVGVKLKFDPPTADTNADKANGFNILWVIIPICAVILLGGALAAFIIIKKKRSKV